MIHRLIYTDKEAMLSNPNDKFMEYARKEAIPLLGHHDIIAQIPHSTNAYHFWLEDYDLTSNCTPDGLKRNAELHLMETESALDYISKHSGVNVDKKGLQNATPKELIAIVRETRRALDGRAA
jgi:hypothetical protein